MDHRLIASTLADEMASSKMQKMQNANEMETDGYACQSAAIGHNWLFPGENFFPLLKRCKMNRRATFKTIGNHR